MRAQDVSGTAGPFSVKGRTELTLAHAAAEARRSRWMASLPESAAETLLRQARIQLFRQGHIVIPVNNGDHPLYLVLRGVIEMALPQRSDTITPVGFLLEGEWFGEYGALTGAASHAEYRARVACCALAVPRASIAALKGDPGFHAATNILMADALLKFGQLLADMMVKKPEDRIKSVLFSLWQRHAAGVNPSGIPISQKDIATITSASRPTVNKLLRALLDAGVITTGYRRIKVHAPEALLGQAPQ